MGAYFKSEYLKIKHTLIGKLIFIAPFLPIALSFVLTTRYFEIDSYNWWYVMLFPGMISLLCTLVVVKDKKMKNTAVLSLPVDLKKIWMAKVLACVCMIVVASMIHLFGSVFIGNVLGIGKFGSIPMINAVFASIVLIITFLWQIPLCMFLASKIGMFSTVLINIVCCFILGVMTAVSDTLWMIPYAVPSRLMIPIIKVLPNGLRAIQESETFRTELLSDSVILPGIIITVSLFVILTFATANWYKKQEAK
ncbi:lantibiotic immunity ABC transporter MutE/EpiE family permease subunit [Clostridium kluyveri]|uniref:lantibiotic immunity ABC transporter MutE/EpiE family permease subunit n=1 Tax=Clostridium kluyveri TaxID=1534 RepID=UPI00224734AF|nr:lantibiotic immunity ABC transporter MutE/EpiE family permease subunit [Clostridium kluyveri]UZQ50981.1 lantibiotic immunity ABC transporter MutE/EpiE family permease subunit [Clostridium kluyveri]